MTREDRIGEETERTLRSWDADGVLSEDPDLYAKVMVLHSERQAHRDLGQQLSLTVKYALLLALLVVNVATGLYVGFSPRDTARQELVSRLQDDLQIDPAHTIP